MEREEILGEEQQRRHGDLFKHLFGGLYTLPYGPSFCGWMIIVFHYGNLVRKQPVSYWNGIWYISFCYSSSGCNTLPRKDLDMFNFQKAKLLKQKTSSPLTLVGNTSTNGAYCIPLQSQIDSFNSKRLAAIPSNPTTPNPEIRPL